MSSTRISRRVNAPRPAVYRALLDARAVATWMVPDGMTSHVHAFDPREGGSFRISLRYDAPTGAGKTTAHTDTYHGRFVKLVPDEQVVEVVEFETADPAMQGEMTITIDLVDVEGGTEVVAVHDGLPRGLSAADNETGWRMSLAKLAALVGASREESAVNQKQLRTTLAHPTPELPVEDVARAQQHYRDALGFEIGWLYPGGDIGAVSRDNVAIFFRRRGRPFEPAVHWVFAADIDATYEELRSRGARIVEPLEKKSWGLRQFTVEDIDGNRFYFHCD